MRQPATGLLLLFLCAVTAIPRAQAPTGLLMGVVVDASDGRPIPAAEVRLGGAGAATAANNVVLADAEGRFVFLNLPKGTFTISATRPGYAEGAYGRQRPAGLTQTLTLADNERIGDLRIPLWKFAAVTGRVLDEAGEPVVGVAVRVLQRTILAGRQKLAPGATIRTDDRGIYRIASLTPGDYAVVVPVTQVSAPDSVVDLFAQRRLAPPKPGEPDLARDLSFSGGTEALNVLDRYRSTRPGMQQFVSAGAGGRAAIAPMGRGGGRIHVYPTTFHPAAQAPSAASFVTLRSGEERTAVDIQISLTPTSSVSGTARGPSGPMMATLSLVNDSEDFSTDAGLEVATTISDAAGKFTFLGVPEGRYRVRAIWAQVPVSGAGRGAARPAPQPLGAPSTPVTPPLEGATLWASQPIAVGSTDITELAINLRSGFRMSGQAKFVGSKEQPAADAIRRMSVTFDPADARPLFSSTVGRGQFDERGRLSSYQLPPARYYVRVNNPPPGWLLKNAMLNGRDISNVAHQLDADMAGLVLTFSDRPSSIAGQVRNSSGVADSTATVLVFPADSGSWTDYGGFPLRLRAIRTDRNGLYQTSGLPAGEYLVIAITEESTNNWQDPRVLQALARLATKISLGEGDARSASLTTAAVQR